MECGLNNQGQFVCEGLGASAYGATINSPIVSDNSSIVPKGDIGNVGPTQVTADIMKDYIPGVSGGGWFTQNKGMIDAGLGLGQLGLGYLGYQSQKKQIASNIADAEQRRRLNEEAAQNKRNIQAKAQSVFGGTPYTA